MKSFLTVCFLLVAGFSFATGNQLAIREKAPLTDVKMKDISGSNFSLSDLKEKNGLAVIFSCNTCPFVIAWEDRYNEIYDWAKKNKVGLAVLNSNHLKRSGDDSFEAMVAHAKDKAYRFPYLVDDESKLANAFGGQTTPHVFLFDSSMELVYKGMIDDNYKNAAEVSTHYLKDAIGNLATGKEITVAETKPMGCSIKRKVE